MRAVMLIRCTLLAIAVLIAGDALAKPKIEKVHEVEGITEYRLKNGLKVLLFPDPSQETVTVNVTYKVGSRHENYGETGMAHLLEHLLFKGSKKFPDITAEISARGAEANGTTWIDRTNYYETFSATPDNVDWALEMEADRMVNSFVAQKDLDSEMTVVRNEFERGENSPFRVLMQNMMATAYMWHNNGKTTIGARSDIENVSIERLQAFYRKYYQPDNAVLTIAGKFDPQRVLKKIQTTFGKIKKPKRTLLPHYTQEPAQSGEKSVTVRRVGDIQWYATAYHVPAGSHPDFASLEVLTEILGDTPRGRLHKALVENKLAVSTFAYPFQLKEPGLMLLAAQVDKESDVQATRTAFLDVVENLEKNPITEDEVDRAKANIEKQIHLAFNSSQKIAILLSEFIGMGDWRLLFLTRDRIDTVSVEDVQKVADTYLQRNNRTEGLFIPAETPERVDVPEAEPVATMLEGYEGREGVAMGEAFDPSFDNIEKRTLRYELKNGAKVLLLPKKSRGEAVVAQFDFNWGTEESLFNQQIVGDTVADMLMRGSEKYTREEIQDTLDSLKASVGMSATPDGMVVSIQTIKSNLLAVIELVNELLKNPKFDEKELEQLQQSHIASIEASRNMPQAVIQREMAKYSSPFDKKGHPGYQYTLDERIEEIKALNVKKLKAYHDQFYAAQNAHLAVVGDIDQDPVLATLKKHFGTWKNKEAYVKISKPYMAMAPKNALFDTPDKDNAAMLVGISLPFGDTHEDAQAMELATYIFGGGFLNSRLATRLRQKDGLSYSAGAWADLSSINESGSFRAYAIFAPENMAAVEAGIREELVKVLNEGFTEAEVKEAVGGYIQRARVRRSKDNALAGLLVASSSLERPLSRYQADLDKLSKLTPQELQAVYKKYLSAEDLVFIKAGDKSKVNVEAAATP